MTGATGFVGGRLAALLRDAGHEVVALVRNPGAATALAERGVDLVAGDVNDPAALNKAADGADGLFHVAGWYKVGARDTAAAWRTNVDGTKAVLDAVRAVKVPRLVYTSTLAVNSDTRGRVVDESFHFAGKHVSVYDETKAEAHKLVEAADDVPAVTVMPGLVYGPGDTSQVGELLKATVKGQRVTAPAGGRVCWGHVDDIAAGHILAMQRGTPGESYMLAGPPASILDGLRAAARIAGTPGPMAVPGGLVRVTAALVRPLPMPATYSAEALRSSLATYLGTPARAERELG